MRLQFSIEYQQCIGKFAADLELCCRELSPGYPVTIPVYIRSYPVVSSQIQSFAPQNQQQQRSRPHSRTSITPSLAGAIAEEQLSTLGKKTFRARMSSVDPNGISIGVTGIDNENRLFSITGIAIFMYLRSYKLSWIIDQEPSKISSSPFKTFYLLNDSDYFRPKLLVDSVNNETESIDQITALYMKGRFLQIIFLVHYFST